MLAALQRAQQAAAALGVERTSHLVMDERDRTEVPRTITVTTSNGDATTDLCDNPEFTMVDNQPTLTTEPLVERLMVTAHEAVATWLATHNLRGAFRTYDEPGQEAAADIDAVLAFLTRS